VYQKGRSPSIGGISKKRQEKCIFLEKQMSAERKQEMKDFSLKRTKQTVKR
jgi:hypothetical protein